MRLREPEEKLKELTGKKLAKLTQNLPQGRQWNSYQVKLITPMLGGGVSKGEPDRVMPVRASAIRGQLRYWWRFLARNHSGRSSRLQGKELFERECEIWGKMTEGKEGNGSSKVFLRVCNVSSTTITRFNDDDKKRYGYALFPAREESNENRSARDILRHGMTFTLDIAFPRELNDVILETVRWWATFGGLGGRTRRGCGSVLVKGIKPIQKEEAKDVGCRLEFCGDDQSADSLLMWKKAVQLLYSFRQKPGIGRNANYGRSKWPEADSIREITNTFSRPNPGMRCNNHRPEHKARISFPRAAFGMPIIFKFKQDDERCGDPEQTELVPKGGERLASPLILTPYPVLFGKQLKFRPAALLMPGSHIRGLALEIKYTGQDNPLPPVPAGKGNQWDESGWSNWQEKWWGKEKKKYIFPLEEAGGDDALVAFMNFFAKGGAL